VVDGAAFATVTEMEELAELLYVSVARREMVWVPFKAWVVSQE
jgi:hypothetical protein